MKATGIPKPEISSIGIIFFALAAMAFGAGNLISGDFVMGRAPAWPQGVAGKTIWAYTSGAWLIISAMMMLIKRDAWWAPASVAALVLVWAVARHMVAGHFHWGTEITQTGKAWTLFGGAAVIATVMNERLSIFQTTILMVGKCCLAAFLIISGVEHFMFAGFVVTLVPLWIPGKLFWTYFAGVALMMGGIGLLIPKTSGTAGLMTGAMIFTWFLILHIPRAVASDGDLNEWTAVFEALAFSGVALVLGSKSENEKVADEHPNIIL